jgi:hypothetical protein
MNIIENKFLSLLALFVIVWEGEAFNEKECDGQQLVNCYIDYLSNFLIPAIPSPPSYQTFSRLYLDDQCKGGWQEQEILCGLQEELIKCMKHNEECLKTSAFQQYLNLGEDDARNYQTDYKVREYQCGLGKNNFENMFFCYLKVESYYDYEIQRCNDIQSSVISKDGYNCSKANEYVACMSQVYGRRCGTAVKPFICNIAEITVRSNTDTTVCDLTMPRCSSIYG